MEEQEFDATYILNIGIFILCVILGITWNVEELYFLRYIIIPTVVILIGMIMTITYLNQRLLELRRINAQRRALNQIQPGNIQQRLNDPHDRAELIKYQRELQSEIMKWEHERQMSQLNGTHGEYTNEDDMNHDLYAIAHDDDLREEVQLNDVEEDFITMWEDVHNLVNGDLFECWSQLQAEHTTNHVINVWIEDVNSTRTEIYRGTYFTHEPTPITEQEKQEFEMFIIQVLNEVRDFGENVGFRLWIDRHYKSLVRALQAPAIIYPQHGPITVSNLQVVDHDKDENPTGKTNFLMGDERGYDHIEGQQLNGTHGEATNEDDMGGKSSVQLLEEQIHGLIDERDLTLFRAEFQAFEKWMMTGDVAWKRAYLTESERNMKRPNHRTLRAKAHAFVLAERLNGTHGEATNEDDMGTITELEHIEIIEDDFYFGEQWDNWEEFRDEFYQMYPDDDRDQEIDYYDYYGYTKEEKEEEILMEYYGFRWNGDRWVQKPNQLNGTHGEATNEDDVDIDDLWLESVRDLTTNIDRERAMEIAKRGRFLTGDVDFLKHYTRYELIEIFGSPQEIKRYHQFHNEWERMNKEAKVVKPEPPKPIPKPKHQKNARLLVEPEHLRFADLPLTGELADAAEVFNYRLKPEDRNLTKKQYKRAIATLVLLEDHEYQTHVNISDVLTKINDAIQSLRTFTEWFTKAAKAYQNLPTLDKVITAIMDLASDLIAVYNLEGLSRVMFIVTRLALYEYRYATISKLIRLLTGALQEQIKKYQEKEDLETQGVDSHVLVAFVKVLAHIIFGVGDAKVAEHDAKRLATFAGMFNSMHQFVTKFEEFFKEVVNYASLHLFGAQPFDRVKQELAAKLATVGNSMLMFINNPPSEMDVATTESVLKVFEEAATCYEELMKIEGHHWNTWEGLYKIFATTIAAAARQAQMTSESKVLPVSIYIGQAAGIGKTNAVRRFSGDLEKLLHETEETQNGISLYEPAFASDYHEAYHGQFATVREEFLMSKTPEVNLGDTAWLNGTHSTVPYPLNMAFERKGSVFYTSRLSWFTGNSPDPKWDSLMHKYSAMAARRLLCLEFKPSDAYDAKTGTWTKPGHTADVTKDYTFKLFSYELPTANEGTPKRGKCLLSGTYQDCLLWMAERALHNEDTWYYSSVASAQRTFDSVVQQAEHGNPDMQDRILFGPYEQALAQCEKMKDTEGLKIQFMKHLKLRRLLSEKKCKAVQPSLIYDTAAIEQPPTNWPGTNPEESSSSPPLDTHGWWSWVTGQEERPTVEYETIRSYLEKYYTGTNLYPYAGSIAFSICAQYAAGVGPEKLSEWYSHTNITGVNISKLTGLTEEDLKGFYDYISENPGQGAVALSAEIDHVMTSGCHATMFIKLLGLSPVTLYKAFVRRAKDRLANVHWKTWVAVAGALAAIAGVSATVYLVYFHKKGEELDAQIYYSQDTKRAAKKKQKMTNLVARSYDAQVGDPSLIDQLGVFATHFGKIRLVITLPDEEPVVRTGTFFAISKNAILINIHYLAPAYGEFDDFEGAKVNMKYVRIQLFAGVTTPEISLNETELIPWIDEDEEFDLVTVIIPQRFWQPVRDLTHLFLLDREFDDRCLSNVKRVKAINPGKSFNLLTEATTGAKFVKSRPGDWKLWAKDPTGKKFEVTNAIEFNIASNSGDCLSMYAIDNTLSERKFFAIHSMGSDTRGVGLAVSQERLDKYVTKPLERFSRGVPKVVGVMDAGGDNLIHELVTQCYDMDLIPEESMLVGALPKEMRKHYSFMTQKSDIYRTKILGGEHEFRKPAVIGLESYKKSMEKMTTPTIRVDDFNLDLAWLRLARDVMAVPPRLPGVLSVSESINHHINTVNISSLRLYTSAGFGFKGNNQGAPGKTLYFDMSDEGELISKEKFDEAFEIYDEHLRNCELVILPFQLDQKIELRTEERVEAMKTRNFFKTPCLSQVGARRYFGAFLDTLRNVELFGYTYGFDLNSAQGVRLAKRLIHKHVLVYDVSNNDMTRIRDQKIRFMAMALAYERLADRFEELSRNEELDPPLEERINARNALQEDFLTTYVQFRNMVVAWLHRLPSGGYATSDFNSTDGKTLLDAALLNFYMEQRPELYEEVLASKSFTDFWFSYHNGDDVLAGFEDDRFFVSIDEITPYLQKYNSTITRPAKGRDKDVLAELGLEDPGGWMFDDTVSYLGRRPAKFLNSYCWRLSPTIIHTIPMWRTRSLHGDEVILPQLCEAALAEWFYFGPHIFNHFKSKYDAELRSLGYPCTSVSYAGHLALWSERQCL